MESRTLASFRIGTRAAPRALLVWAVVLLAALARESEAAPAGPALLDAGALHEADLVFQTSRSSQSLAIQLATHSRFSHVGIVHNEGGKTFVYEAVGPVKLTPLREWLSHGEGSHFVVMRLKDAGARLTPDALRAMRRAGARFSGRPYDFAFGWSDDRVYCSELVWKIYREGLGVELGSLQRLGDLDLTHPAVQAKLRERYGSRIPLGEPVISPGAIAASPLLETVLAE